MTKESTPIKNLIVDMDGVLWRGNMPLPGLVPFFEKLNQLQIGFILATNNATKIADQYVEKLNRFGVTIGAEKILTSAEATSHYLSQMYPTGSKVYVVGESGLKIAMGSQGFELLEGDGFVGLDARVDTVVVGMTSQVCYPQLASAAHLINHGARFVGTNPDVTFPSEFGPLPGAGSILAFLQTATGAEPLIIGKPNPLIFGEALRRLPGNRENTAMVGDRLGTDIAGAQAVGLRSILLMTGVTSSEDLAGSAIRPDWIFDDLPDLTANLFNLT